MSKQLLVEGDRVRLLAEQAEAQRLHPARGKAQFRPRLRLAVAGFVFQASSGSHRELQSKARGAIYAGIRQQGLQRGGAGEVFGLHDIEGPEGHRFDQREPASHVALRLAIGRVENRAARDRSAVAQSGIAKLRPRLHKNERRRRRQIVRRQLVDQVGGEVGEFMLELELDSSGQKRGALKQSADHRIEIVIEQSAQALRHARIFLGEFGRLFTKYC